MDKDCKQLWQDCCRIISDNIPREQYDAWFKDISAVSYERDQLLLLAPSEFFVDQLENRYLDILKKAIFRVFGPQTRVYYDYYTVQADPKSLVHQRSSSPSATINEKKNSPSANPFTAEATPDFDPQLNPRYTFENYCTGQSNNIARSLAESIANNPKVKTFNPLFVFGSTGVGKTHLIQAIGIRIKERNPQARVLYVTSRLFESQYTAAVRKGVTNSFFHFYQSVDTLIIDDVQELSGKTATQNTFFHIFNHLHQNNRQIIMSSDRSPAEMEGIEERLLSRFKWGLATELFKPDLALRREVLVQKAEQDGLSLPDDVVDFIAANVTESIRELEGIVVSLVAHATVLNREIDLSLAQTVMAHAVKINRKKVNFEMIAQAVSQHFGIEADRLFTRGRMREVSDPRQILMYLAKKLTDMPLATIGRRIGRNHTTVIYTVKTIAERMAVDRKLAADIEAIENLLSN